MEKLSTKEDLQKVISENDGITVAKFYADWCGPCKTLGKIIEEGNFEGVKFYEVDVDEADCDFIDEFKIRNIPVLVFFKNGVQVDKTVGTMSKSDLENKINDIKSK